MSDLTIIQSYCKNGDTRQLQNLSRNHEIMFQQLCIYVLKKSEGNKKLARNFLSYYGLDEEGNRILKKKPPYNKVLGQVMKMSVALTGARKGDVLSGASKGSKGALIKIHNEDVPPMRRTLDGVRAYPDIWEKFINKLGSIPYFTNMSRIQRQIWLLTNEVANEDSIGEEGSRIEVLQPGIGDLSTKLSEQELNKLINGNPYSTDGYWSSKEIESMIPGKPGTRARRHTLILIRSFWKITTDYSVLQYFNDLTIDVFEGKLNNLGIEKSEEEIFILGNITRELRRKGSKWIRPSGHSGVQSLGFQVPKKRVDLESLRKVSSDNIILKAFRNFTGASYKSLIQKIIRFRPKMVDLGNGKFPAPNVLYVAMRSLAQHPGAFIPDIQRFVTGLESLSKRLGIIIVEDSMVPLNEIGKILLSLFSSSILCQRVRGWLPDRELLDKWFEYGIIAWNSESALKIDYKVRKPFVVKYGQSSLETASALLDELRSFEGDLALVRGLAQDYPRVEPKIVKGFNFPEVMPLCHCVDQHWAPGMVHYFDPLYVEKVSKGHTTSRPFDKLFSLIWNKCSKQNPRKVNQNWKMFEKQSDIIKIRKAQKLYLIAKQQDHNPRTKLRTDKKFVLKYTLKDSWLAGLIGAIEVSANRKLHHPAMLVTLSVDNPLKLLAIRRPSRNMTEDPLSDEAKEYAISVAKSRLKIGLSLNKAKSPAPIMENSVLILNRSEDTYFVRKVDNKVSVPWDTIKKLTIDIPFVKDIGDWTIAKALVTNSIGIEMNADKKLLKLIQNTPDPIVRHALIYLSTFSSTIEMNRVSRDGGGTYKAVSIYDVGAYQFMLKLSSIYPGALSPSLYKPSSFSVPIGPLLWTLKDRISKILSKGEQGDPGWSKVFFKDNKRKLWNHQKETVQDMINNRKAGNKGNFIWSIVGMGKTLSVLKYLQYLKENNKLSKYIIYTLPQSAMKSIIEEIKYFDVPINLIIPLKNIKKHTSKYPKNIVSQDCTPVANTINLIEHDHLRRCTSVLLEYASRSFFIVDEVHKTLNDTLRTSISLELAHLSRDFIVLTGTPVIDNDTHKLIGWLKQVVPFEVNRTNFWAAANAMIAKIVNTGIKVDDKDIITDFNVEEQKEYRLLVPPALGGTNNNPLYEDWVRASSLCYEACNRKMIDLTRKYLKRGVVLVAKDSKHQQILYQMISKYVQKSDIFVLQGSESIFLTDEAVKNGKIHGYKVVIVPQRKAEGYTLTYLSVMITSVYPSNNATREQLRGRINRISQKSSDVLYRTVHTGILTNLLHNHNSAKNLSIALKGLSKQIN